MLNVGDDVTSILLPYKEITLFVNIHHPSCYMNHCHHGMEYNIRTDLNGNRVGRWRLHSSGTGQGTVAGSCEHGNEP
jgi:hypothetical protein